MLESVIGTPGGPSITIIHNSEDKVMINNGNQVIGNNVGGVVGGGVVNARDISMFKQYLSSLPELTPETKEALVKAREITETENLPATSKNDVADSIGVLTTELRKPNQNLGRIKSILNRIGTLVPTALSALKGIKIIAELMAGEVPSETN